MEQTPQWITCSLLNCTAAAVHGLDIVLEEEDLVCSELTPHPESQLWSDNIQKHSHSFPALERRNIWEVGAFWRIDNIPMGPK